MIKISVIIPVYNCEQYIEHCVDSALQQSIKDIEVICVDDGSKDRTANIINTITCRDSRVLLIQQENQGPGIARNNGIRKAKGEYIAFLDADDFYLDRNALENMYTLCESEKVDACGTNIYILREGSIVEDSTLLYLKEKSKGSMIFNYKDCQIDYGYCGFIFKRKLVVDNNILFPNYIRFEDPVFLTQALFVAQKFGFIDSALYCYRAPNQITKYNAHITIDLLKGLIDNLQFASNKGLDLLFKQTVKRLEEEYENTICYNIADSSIDILELLLKANSIIRKEYKSEDYVIVPLKKILCSLSDMRRYTRKEILSKIKKSKRVFLYGAGKAAGDILRYLKTIDYGNKVNSIIVTSKENNPSKVENCKVIELGDYQYEDDDLILVTITGIQKNNVVNQLNERGIAEVFVVDMRLLQD